MTTEAGGQDRGSPTRPSRGSRRIGYVIAVAVHLVLIWWLHVSPGWRSLPLLTAEFSEVLGWVTASLLVGIAVNLLYLASDPVWLRRLGDAVTGTFACVVLARMWQVFPLDVGARWSGWQTPMRVLLFMGFIAAVIAVVANLAEAIRAGAGGKTPRPRASGRHPTGHHPA